MSMHSTEEEAKPMSIGCLMRLIGLGLILIFIIIDIILCHI